VHLAGSVPKDQMVLSIMEVATSVGTAGILMMINLKIRTRI
jgi:hypothetical protein